MTRSESNPESPRRREVFLEVAQGQPVQRASVTTCQVDDRWSLGPFADVTCATRSVTLATTTWVSPWPFRHRSSRGAARRALARPTPTARCQPWHVRNTCDRHVRPGPHAGHAPDRRSPAARHPTRPSRRSTARYVQDGPPLGVHANVRYETATIDLQPGDSVTFYTDGLIERRGRNLDEGIQQLRNILTSTPHDQSVHDLCDAIADSCFPEEQPTDDICVLVARRPRTTQAGMSNVR